MRWSLRAILFSMTCLVSLSCSDWANERPRLDTAEKWAYQLQGDISSLKTHDAGIAVVDVDAVSGATLAALKRKSDGGRRAVLSYISVGEAEAYRRYFRTCCLSGQPTWLTDVTQGWADNYLVRYWESEWKEIVMHRLLAAVAAGFDGAFFDRVDSWEAFRDTVPSARQDMIDFVRELSAAARRLNPNFLIVVQNAEELLADDRYLAAIDGVAKEDLLFGMNHNPTRNDESVINNSLRHLKHAQEKGKAVLVVEYNAEPEALHDIAAEIRSHGFIPCLATRALDRTPL